jgi:hypothetical protein
MSSFASAAEVDCYVGGVLRLAAIDPYLGPRLAEASLTLRVTCTDLPACLTVEFFEPVTVSWNDVLRTADVELTCSSDFLDAFLRGEQALVDALAHGDVVARGRVSKVLKVLPLIEQAFPYYRQLVAVKDRAAGLTPGVPS